MGVPFRWRTEEGEEIKYEIPLELRDQVKRPTPIDLVKGSRPDHLICKECNKIMQNPGSAVPCGCIFCRSCLQGIVNKDSPVCPSCNDPLEAHINGARPTKIEVDKLQFWCENAVAFDVQKNNFVPLEGMEGSCQEALPLSNLENHIRSCIFSPTFCPNKKHGCQLIATKPSLESHKENCAYASEICLCGEEVLSAQSSEHKSSCQAVEVHCPQEHFGCTFKDQRGYLNQHLGSCHFEAVKPTLHKLKVLKEASEAYIWATEKLIIQGPSDRGVHWEEFSTQTQREAMDKLTNMVHPEVREECEKQLAEKFQQQEFTELCKKAQRLWSSSGPPQLLPVNTAFFTPEEIMDFAPKEIKEITENFKYRVGSGSSGEVFRGNLCGTPVAVKKVKNGQLGTMKKEVDVLNRLKHPHIVLVIGCCPQENCIVTEFLGGGCLEERLKAKETDLVPTFPWKDRLRILCEISSALVFMHSRDILHRDLKPANILLSESNSSKLADFGLAKKMGTPFSGIKGSPGHLAPYLAHSRPCEASDVYSLGVIMLQLLTGKKDINDIRDKYRAPRKVDRYLLAEMDSQVDPLEKEMAKPLFALSLKIMNSNARNCPELKSEIIPEIQRIYNSVFSKEFPSRTLLSPGISRGKGRSYSTIPSYEGLETPGNRRRSIWPFQTYQSVESAERIIAPKDYYVPWIPHSDLLNGTNSFSAQKKLGSQLFECIAPDGTLWVLRRAKQKLDDFEKEVDTLSQIHHKSVVQLLGYCDAKEEQILVFEFWGHGNLRQKLDLTSIVEGNIPLSLLQRVEIAVEVAEGIKYLHTKINLIHNSISSKDILLRLTPEGLQSKITCVSTQNNCPRGYIDPYKSSQSAKKSDVYSFGVVLIELITGRQALFVMKTENGEEDDEDELSSLVNWIQPFLFPHKIQEVLDPTLGKDFNIEAMNMLVKLAKSCTEGFSKFRPDMSEVCRQLSDVKILISGVTRDEHETEDV